MVFQKNVRGKNPVTKTRMDILRKAYIKVYGDNWRKMFAKHYWGVYDGAEIGSTDVVKIEARSRCASDLNRKI